MSGGVTAERGTLFKGPEQRIRPHRMESLAVKDFDLAATVTSGHLFAYDALAKNTFRIINGDKSFIIGQEKGRVTYSGITGDELRRFFDFGLDVDALHRRLGTEKPLARLLPRYRGIRLVRQDVRQAILTFILSSNNNQKRIKRMMDSLRMRYGEKRDEYHTLPLKGKIVHEKNLLDLNFGYRSPFVVGTERLLTSKFLERLKTLPYEEARAALLQLPGVGPKVADCVLAYSELAKGEAFPADVWVKRALKTWYPSYFKNTPLTDKNIRVFVKEKFGDDASYAQHYLFLAAQELLG
jgi:N-glycosylase/DNA lyase